MPRRPTQSQLANQVDDLIAALRTAKTVFPVLAEQARLELQELTGHHPAAPSCDVDDCDGRPHRGWMFPHPAKFEHDPPPHYADPTGETVVNFRPARDGNCDPTEDLERIARWVADVQHLISTTRRMLNNTPAVTLAVVDGRKPTDGRSAEEHAQRRFVRVLSGEPCLVAQDHEHTDRFGPGHLRRGLCNKHRMAFTRWQLANGHVLQDLDEATRLVRWQHATYGTVAKETGGKQPAGPYRDNLKEVA